MQEVDISSAAWAWRNLGRPHARMELDPNVWEHVERFILNAIPK
jgi:hypothetical protein